MNSLTVLITGSAYGFQNMALPVNIHAPNGSILLKGIVSPSQPATFEVPDQFDRVYVVVKLPNSSSIQQPVDFHNNNGQAEFNLGIESPHEWLSWVTPFRSISHLKEPNTFNRHIGNVWMALWTLNNGRWESRRVDTSEFRQDSGIKQLVLDVTNEPHLLQIGGEEVAWRLISLPPSGRVRVALTRSASEKGDALDITIGRVDPDNELIMSYLARGAITEADRLTDAWSAADKMLSDKSKNPVSAAAGAYILFKINRLELRSEWLTNLVNWFPNMADGAIVAAGFAAQQEGVKESEIRSLISIALNRGLPIFSMGASILVETMAAIHRGNEESKRFHESYLAAQAYQRANCSKGAYFAFYGRSPAEPSWAPIYGFQSNPRNTPGSSAETASPVVYSRPRGSKSRGQYGNTRVVLPQARVSPPIADELRNRAFLPSNVIPPTKLDMQNTIREPLVLQQIRSYSVPALETNFLNEFFERFGENTRKSDDVTPVQKSREKSEQKDEPIEREASPRRQTAKYWQEERLSNSMNIFEEGE